MGSVRCLTGRSCCCTSGPLVVRGGRPLLPLRWLLLARPCEGNDVMIRRQQVTASSRSAGSNALLLPSTAAAAGAAGWWRGAQQQHALLFC